MFFFVGFVNKGKGGVVGVRHVWSLYLSFDCCYINLLGKEGEEEQEEEEEQRSKIEYLECEV